MKYFGVTGLLLISTFCGLAYTQSHNVEWGKREIGDVLLYREIVKVPSKWLQIVKKDILYPSMGLNVRKLTYIKASDQHQDGTGAYASLLQGGAGFGNVKVHFKSQRSHGINFILEIYGHY